MDKNTEKILMKLPDEVKSRLLRLPERFISDFEEIMNITVRQSRQSGVARATCPD